MSVIDGMVSGMASPTRALPAGDWCGSTAWSLGWSTRIAVGRGSNTVLRLGYCDLGNPSAVSLRKVESAVKSFVDLYLRESPCQMK